MEKPPLGEGSGGSPALLMFGGWLFVHRRLSNGAAKHFKRDSIGLQSREHEGYRDGGEPEDEHRMNVAWHAGDSKRNRGAASNTATCLSGTRSFRSRQ